MVNKVIFVGRLTRDPELRYTPSGTAVCNTALAVDSGWGDNKKTLFIDIVVWGKQAEAFSKYMSKGKLCYFEGRLEKQEWEKDGVKRSKMEAVAETVKFLSPKGESSPSTESGAPPEETTDVEPF